MTQSRYSYPDEITPILGSPLEKKTQNGQECFHCVREQPKLSLFKRRDDLSLNVTKGFFPEIVASRGLGETFLPDSGIWQDHVQFC